jgi:hypothetical protein
MPEDAKQSAPVEVKSEGGRKLFIQNNNNNQPFVPTAKFKGDFDDLKGYIFDFSDPRQVDMFVKTCKKLAKYVGKTWYRNHGGDMERRVKT